MLPKSNTHERNQRQHILALPLSKFQFKDSIQISGFSSELSAILFNTSTKRVRLRPPETETTIRRFTPTQENNEEEVLDSAKKVITNSNPKSEQFFFRQNWISGLNFDGCFDLLFCLS